MYGLYSCKTKIESISQDVNENRVYFSILSIRANIRSSTEYRGLVRNSKMPCGTYSAGSESHSKRVSRVKSPVKVPSSFRAVRQASFTMAITMSFKIIVESIF